MNLYATELFKYITGEMVKESPIVMTIADVRMEQLQSNRGSEDKPVVYFKERKKGAVLNKTNAKTLIEYWGPETSAWKGQRVSLFAEAGTWFGKSGFALRMRPAANGNGPNGNGVQPQGEPEAEVTE